MHDVLQLVLDRTEIIEDGVPPFRVVKVIDVARDPSVGQFGCQIRVIESQVTVEGAEEGLCDDIVSVVTPPDHAANNPTGPLRDLVFVAGVGAPSVRVPSVCMVERPKGKVRHLMAAFRAVRAS